MNRITTTTIILAAFAAAITATAEPFSSRDVSDQAQWVAHVDFDRFNRTRVAEAVLERILASPEAHKYHTFKTIFRIDPQRDFHGLTAYGFSDGDKDAVVLLNADHDRQTILTLLKSNERYREALHRSYTLHQVEDDKKFDAQGNKEVGWVAFHGAKTAIYSKTQGHVRTALDVLDGKSPNLGAAEGSLTVPVETSFFAATVDIAGLAPRDPGQAAFLKNAKSLALLLDEKGENVICSLAVTAVTEEAAVELTEAAQGLIAITKLSAKNDPGKQWLLDLTDSLATTRKGAEAILSLNIPVAKVISHIEEGRVGKRMNF